MQTRRTFGKLLLGSVGVLSTLGTMTLETACTFGTVFASILKYVNVGLQAFQSIVDLLSGAGVLPVGEGTVIDTAILLVKTGFADLQTAVNNYNASTGDKTTLLGKISTALSVLQASIQQFWNDLKIPDSKLSSLVQGLLGVILSVLAGFATQLPTPATTAIAKRAAELPNRINVPAQKLSPKEFKAKFNQQLTENGYTQYIVK
jgi:hypothetical protein